MKYDKKGRTIKYEFTYEALHTMTRQQCVELDRIGYVNDNVIFVVVQRGGFDLPADYLTVRIEYRDGSSIYGGISPEGVLST